LTNKDSYHHGYLKQTMIEEGIKYINRHGIENMSLRKLASICNVSHAAPYKHFKDKDDFINQIIMYIVDKFMDTLTAIVRKYEGTHEIMTELGVGYVDFFARNPNYFFIIFSENQVNFEFILSENEESFSSFPPYQVFRESAVKFMKLAGIPSEENTNQIIFMWALVQGLASIFTLKGMQYNEQQKASIRRILGIKTYFTDNGNQ